MTLFCFHLQFVARPMSHRKSLAYVRSLRAKLEGPPTLLCYMCGREFGISSLQIHQKACLHKVKALNQKRTRVSVRCAIAPPAAAHSPSPRRSLSPAHPSAREKSKQVHLPPPPTTNQPTRRSKPSLFEAFNKESWELFCQHSPDEAERLLQDAQAKQAKEAESTTLDELWDERFAGTEVETPVSTAASTPARMSVRSAESLALAKQINALRGMVEFMTAQRQRELVGDGTDGARSASLEEQRARLRERLHEIANVKLTINAIYQQVRRRLRHRPHPTSFRRSRPPRALAQIENPEAGVVLTELELEEFNRVKEAVRLLEASELAQQSNQIDSLLQKVIDLEQRETLGEIEDAKVQSPTRSPRPRSPRPRSPRPAASTPGTEIVLASLMQKISLLEAKEAENAAAVEKVLITCVAATRRSRPPRGPFAAAPAASARARLTAVFPFPSLIAPTSAVREQVANECDDGQNQPPSNGARGAERTRGWRARIERAARDAAGAVQDAQRGGGARSAQLARDGAHPARAPRAAGPRGAARARGGGARATLGRSGAAPNRSAAELGAPVAR
jgi:hypothetical protein